MKKKMKRLLLCFLISVSALCLWGCSSDETEAPDVNSIDISISMDFPAKAKMPDLKTLPFRVEEETSVLEAVELYGNVNNISILVDTTYSTLEGIDGVINDVTQKAGEWQYKINGEVPDKPIHEAELKDGDHLELIYTKVSTTE